MKTFNFSARRFNEQQTEALTMQALSMGVENVVEAVCKLVNAAAEHCAKEATRDEALNRRKLSSQEAS